MAVSKLHWSWWRQHDGTILCNKTLDVSRSSEFLFTRIVHFSFKLHCVYFCRKLWDFLVCRLEPLVWCFGGGGYFFGRWLDTIYHDGGWNTQWTTKLPLLTIWVIASPIHWQATDGGGLKLRATLFLLLALLKVFFYLRIKTTKAAQKTLTKPM